MVLFVHGSNCSNSTKFLFEFHFRRAQWCSDNTFKAAKEEYDQEEVWKDHVGPSLTK
jgi:hypothetical protein